MYTRTSSRVDPESQTSYHAQTTTHAITPAGPLFGTSRVALRGDSKPHTAPDTPSVQPKKNRALAGLDRRTGRGVRRGHGVVDVDHDARVGGRVRAGEGDRVFGREGARAAADGDLRARYVVLCAAHRAGAVQGHVLRPQKVLAVCEATGEGDVDGRLAYFFGSFC